MKKGGIVSIDAEEYLRLLDEMAELEKRLRKLGRIGYKVDGLTTKPPPPASRGKKEQAAAMEVDISISEIEWQTKDKQPADPDDPWCWAFSTTRDGGIRRECMELVRAIELYGTVKVGQYEISLGGRDGNLLNRKKV